MADEKAHVPLLVNELTAVECGQLNQTMNTPGFQVLVKLNEAACLRANEDAIKLDPEGTDYERKLSVRTQRARNFNELVQIVRASALLHVNKLKQEAQKELLDAEVAVANRFGIHTVKPAETPDAIQKTFGTRPVKPQKKA